MVSAPTDTGTTLHVARQPILDDRNRVFAYELLYRGSSTDLSCPGAGDSASAQVLTAALFDIGLDTLTGGRPAFVNITGDLLLSGIDAIVPPTGIVLELLETIDVTPAIVAACRDLKTRGYQLALDDFEPGSPAEALFPFVAFVKVDVLATPLRQAAALAARLKRTSITMLAEKVETQAVYEATRAAGFSLFQGYHFCKPAIQHGAAIPPQQLAYVQLLTALNQPDLTVQELETLVKRDVSLSVRVLRFANSAAVPMRTEVSTIAQALLFIGIGPIRKWASVWCMAGLNQDAAPELSTLALVRARTCELLGERLPGADPSELFLVGLCSLLDVMLQRPMDEVLHALRLSASASDALRGVGNKARAVLDAVVAYDQGRWDASMALASSAGTDGAHLAASHADALRWARDIARGGLI